MPSLMLRLCVELASLPRFGTDVTVSPAATPGIGCTQVGNSPCAVFASGSTFTVISAPPDVPAMYEHAVTAPMPVNGVRFTVLPTSFDASVTVSSVHGSTAGVAVVVDVIGG